MASKKKLMARVEARNPEAQAKIGYHGDLWQITEENHVMRYNKGKGPCYVLRSRDGSKVLFVAMTDDNDFIVRKVQ